MGTIKNFLSGTFLGLILGGLLGLLLAPTNGSQTRAILNQKISDSSQQIKQAMNQRRMELEEEIHSYSK